MSGPVRLKLVKPYGRDHELRTLSALLIVERIVIKMPIIRANQRCAIRARQLASLKSSTGKSERNFDWNGGIIEK